MAVIWIHPLLATAGDKEKLVPIRPRPRPQEQPRKEHAVHSIELLTAPQLSSIYIH